MNANEKLLESLTELETALGTPIVSGEQEAWTERAKEAFATMQQEFKSQVATGHEEVYAQILEEDLGLAAQVEELKGDDQRLLQEVEKMAHLFDQLHHSAESVEPDENQIHNRVEQLIESGIQLVVDVRRQETAITTWYTEALERDRGVVD